MDSQHEVRQLAYLNKKDGHGFKEYSLNVSFFLVLGCHFFVSGVFCDSCVTPLFSHSF